MMSCRQNGEASTVSVVCEGEQTYGSSGEVSEGSPSDYDPFKLHVTGEAERHPEPFPQERFGVRTRPAVPLGRRKGSAAGEAQDSGKGFPFPGLPSSPGGFAGVRVPPAVSKLSAGLNRYCKSEKQTVPESPEYPQTARN